MIFYYGRLRDKTMTSTDFPFRFCMISIHFMASFLTVFISISQILEDMLRPIIYEDIVANSIEF